MAAKDRSAPVKRRRLTALPPPASVPALTRTQASAVKSLMQGTADAHTQKTAMDWIIGDLCGIGAVSFRPDDPHSTAFLEGRRFVASQIIHIATQPMSNLKVEDDRQD